MPHWQKISYNIIKGEDKVEIDIRNLDLVIELLECVDELCKKEPQKYSEMIHKLHKIMEKYNNIKGE